MMIKFHILVSLLCLAVLQNSPAHVTAEDTIVLPTATKVRAEFEEFRYSPARRLPGRFLGIMRWDSDLGLSLEYQRPRHQWIAITQQGNFRRSQGTEFRRLPTGGGPRSGPGSCLMSLPEGWLCGQTVLHIQSSTENAKRQILELSPIEGERLDGLFLHMKFVLCGDNLESIEVRRDQRSRIEIRILSSDRNPHWSAEELRESFVERHSIQQ
ncbi:MAG: hypothetical protein LR015_02680 [Verrucomicrobia bacterium]|nr:hypothetical protein [Verrucomicrobiota bacterium]